MIFTYYTTMPNMEPDSCCSDSDTEILYSDDEDNNDNEVKEGDSDIQIDYDNEDDNSVIDLTLEDIIKRYVRRVDHVIDTTIDRPIINVLTDNHDDIVIPIS